mgnify:CR=1 FL=1
MWATSTTRPATRTSSPATATQATTLRRHRGLPLGYGMSYTNFDISDMNVSYNAADDTYTVTVKVTNTGDMAGKKTVQVYVQSPYTDYDKENGVEKSAVSLVGFGKTGMIEPGASETLSMTVNKRDIVPTIPTAPAPTSSTPVTTTSLPPPMPTTLSTTFWLPRATPWSPPTAR